MLSSIGQTLKCLVFALQKNMPIIFIFTIDQVIGYEYYKKRLNRQEELKSRHVLHNIPQPRQLKSYIFERCVLNEFAWIWTLPGVRAMPLTSFFTSSDICGVVILLIPLTVLTFSIYNEPNHCKTRNHPRNFSFCYSLIHLPLILKALELQCSIAYTLILIKYFNIWVASSYADWCWLRKNFCNSL